MDKRCVLSARGVLLVLRSCCPATASGDLDALSMHIPAICGRQEILIREGFILELELEFTILLYQMLILHMH